MLWLAILVAWILWALWDRTFEADREWSARNAERLQARILLGLPPDDHGDPPLSN